MLQLDPNIPKIHESAVAIFSAGRGHVGWMRECREFSFQAIQSLDGYVDLSFQYDNDPIDVSQHPTWEQARNWLDKLITSSKR